MTNTKPRAVKARYCDTKIEVQQYAGPEIAVHEKSHKEVSIQRKGQLRNYLLSNLKDTEVVSDIMLGAEKVLKEKRAICIDTAISIATQEMYSSKEFDAVRTALSKYIADEPIAKALLVQLS